MGSAGNDAMTIMPFQRDQARVNLQARLAPIDYSGLGDEALLRRLLDRNGGAAGTIATDLLARFGSVAEAASADLGELARATGAEPVVLEALGLARELALRLAQVEACRRPALGAWSAVVAYARAALARRPREQFRVLFLDRRNHLLRDEWVADGSVDHAPVYNSGPSRVARLGRVPSIPETEQYVASVIDCYLALTAGQAVTNSRQCRSSGGGR